MLGSGDEDKLQMRSPTEIWPPTHEPWRIPFPIVVALTVNFFVALAVWPGFMSWDSLLALKQLRTGITSSAYPPMVSYMWALPDLLIPGPGGMLLLQNGILFVALGMLFYAFGLSSLATLALFVLFVASPILIGPMLVVWKDVGMSACLLLSVALAVFYMRHRQSRYLVASMVMMVIGGAYRLNAFAALLPLILAMATLALYWRQPETSVLLSARWLLRLLGLSVLLGVAALVLIALSLSFRLPDLKPLPSVFSPAFPQVYDLLGISACAERVLLPNELMRRPMSADDMKRLYDPRHVQLSFDMSNTGNPALLKPTFGSGDQIANAWWGAIRDYPGCYLMHRLRVLSYLIGANRGEVFYVTHPYIDQNDLGIQMTPTPLTAKVLHMVNGDSPLARLWIFMVVAALVTVWLYWVNRYSFWLAVTLMVSSLLYLTGNVAVLPAADARYQHWIAVCMFVIIALGVKQAERMVQDKRCQRSSDRSQLDHS
jgi:hypothetical protein